MKDLIPVTQNEKGQQIVSARELYEGLGLNKANWKRWYKSNIVENEYFKENEDWVGFIIMMNGNETQDFAITLDFAKHIAMMARTEKSHQYRNYFIEIEKQLKENKPKLPTTYKEALIELVHQIEEKERLEEEKKRLIHNTKMYTTTEIAKELGFKSAIKLNKDLEEKKLQYKVNGTWVLCARFSECGYVNIKQTELDNGRIIYDRKWTGLGRDWLINEVYKEEIV